MENQELDIKNLQFTSEDTGSFFSKTYTEYNWKFSLDGIQRSIKLNHSKILGRRTIFLGNQEICRYQRYTYNFHYSFPIEVHTISITQNEDTYILKIDDIPFNRLLNEQKLRRFNIIKETFLEKSKKPQRKKDKEIRKFRTFNRGSSSIPISRRSEDQRYRTDIYSTNRNIEEQLNIDNENNIDTSTNKNNIDNDNNDDKINNNENLHQNDIILNQEQYFDYYNDGESSDDLSNKAIDGGDSNKDEDEDENEDNDDDKTIKESFRPPDDDLFNNENHFEENEEEFDENEENNIEEENNINNNDNEEYNIINKRDEDDEEEEIGKDKDKNNIINYNKINNELQPIKPNKKEKKLNKIKIDSKKDIKKHKKKLKENISNIDNENNINNDNNIYNINNENNINNINNDNNHIDLLGEEIYNSSRDKDLYNNNINNNINNNLNINYLLYQKQQKYIDYKSNNPSNPFEDDSIKTN